MIFFLLSEVFKIGQRGHFYILDLYLQKDIV